MTRSKTIKLTCFRTIFVNLSFKSLRDKDKVQASMEIRKCLNLNLKAPRNHTRRIKITKVHLEAILKTDQ